MSRRTEKTKHDGIRKRIDDNGTVTYQIRWYSKNGKRQSATRDTLRQAIDFRDEMLRQRRQGASADLTRGRQLYGDYAKQWWKSRIIRESTNDTELSYFERRILPEWGSVPLSDITAPDIRAWLNELLSDEISVATVKKVYRIFSQPIRIAASDGDIPTDPTLKVKSPKVEDVEARFLKPDEVARIEAVIDEHWRMVIPLIVDTGLRIGEVAALRVCDVEFLAGAVTVTKTATRGRHGVRVENAPKSKAGTRRVPTLTAGVAERLAEMVAERGLGPNDRLFTGPRGGAMSPNNFRNRIWHPAIEEAEIEGRKPTPHALRHTAVSLWIISGYTDPLKIKKWAGHTSITTTYNLYGHLLPDDTNDLRTTLEAIRKLAEQEIDKAGEMTVLDELRRRREVGEG